MSWPGRGPERSQGYIYIYVCAWPGRGRRGSPQGLPSSIPRPLGETFRGHFWDPHVHRYKYIYTAGGLGHGSTATDATRRTPRRARARPGTGSPASCFRKVPIKSMLRQVTVAGLGGVDGAVNHPFTSPGLPLPHGRLPQGVVGQRGSGTVPRSPPFNRETVYPCLRVGPSP